MRAAPTPALADRGLFLGRIDDELAVPFPRLADGERKTVPAPSSNEAATHT